MAWVQEYTTPRPVQTPTEDEVITTTMGTSEISRKMFDVATECFWWVVPTPQRYNDERDSAAVIFVVVVLLLLSFLFSLWLLRRVMWELQQLWHEHFEKL